MGSGRGVPLSGDEVVLPWAVGVGPEDVITPLIWTLEDGYKMVGFILRGCYHNANNSEWLVIQLYGPQTVSSPITTPTPSWACYWLVSQMREVKVGYLSVDLHGIHSSFPVGWLTDVSTFSTALWGHPVLDPPWHCSLYVVARCTDIFRFGSGGIPVLLINVDKPVMGVNRVS